jgi:outer membrane receptor protein involved in Fe transport
MSKACVAVLLMCLAPCVTAQETLLLDHGATSAVQEKTPAVTSDKAHLRQLSGTVVDPSGAAIAGATVQLRSADGRVRRTTLSDANGSFIISGLASGDCRLVVSTPGFESKEIPVTLGPGETPAPLRISLGVGLVSTTINVHGRQDDLVGIAESAGQVTVGATELEDRPILRSGEVLETLPGLIITQHAGGGKANQYFMRGFNLDHGTDFAIFLDGMPLNLPSHAHGEGYSDMNTVIPEFVQRIDAAKGPYYADVGDYGSAGNAHVVFYKTLPQNFFQVDGGEDQFARFVFGVSRKLGEGTLLYGAEAYHDAGPWVHSDNYYKFNGLLTYSQGTDANGFSITSHAYDGARWNSSDQLPSTAIPVVGFFGSLSPTDGGRSQRYSLQGEWHRQDEHSATQLMAYGFYYDLNLFSDFTDYLVDPYIGDQFEQQDRRWVAGFDFRHMIYGRSLGRKTETTFGLQLRNDWIHNGLFRTEDRGRTSKTDYIAGIDPATGLQSVLPADTDLNKFTETIGSPWVESKIQWASKFRSILALRGDEGKGVITSFTNPTNLAFNPNTQQEVNKFLPSPKASLIFGPWANTELYVQGGASYHTNDVRGSTQRYEPVSPDYPYINCTDVTCAPQAGNALTQGTVKIPFLAQTKGAEVGARTVPVPQLQSTVEVWYLHSNSELLQDGDTGGTIPSLESSNRWGFEVGNYYTPTPHLVFDADFADSRARFTMNDPFDSTFLTSTPSGPQLCARNSNCYNLVAFSAAANLNPNATNSEYANPGAYFAQNPGSARYVPEAVRWVVSAGATLHQYKGFSASLRLRYFGPRPLTSDAIYVSPSTALVNLGANYRFNSHWSLHGEILNLLNRQDHDVDYAYVSQINPASELIPLAVQQGVLPAGTTAASATPTQVAAAVNANAAFTRVMHPVEPIEARFSLRFSFGGY